MTEDWLWFQLAMVDEDGGLRSLTEVLLASGSLTAPQTSRDRVAALWEVAALVLKECNAVGKKNGIKAMETLSAVVLTPDEWTPETGLVTAAQKIHRSAIAKKFDSEIKEAYKNQ
ncbi:hypothetical protein C8R46DRAFT_1029863 [Mycena filopes]|nr:hypothetical protein C8R46DRAFT_1029863 [Mycena filopes]